MSKYRDFQNFLVRMEYGFDGENYSDVKDRLKEIVFSSNPKDTALILKTVMELDDKNAAKRQVYYILADIYVKTPSVQKQVLSFLNSEYSNKELDAFYQNASRIAKASKSEYVRWLCINQIEQKINSPQNNPYTLKVAYRALGRLFDDNDDVNMRSQVVRLIENGLDHPNNDVESFRAGERILSLKENLKSRAILGERVEKNLENPFGFRRVDEIAPDEPCVFILPGNGTTSEQVLNGYFSDMESFLAYREMKEKIRIYGTLYRFGDYANPAVSVKKQMAQYHRLKKDISDMESENVDPRYVNEIFSKVILNRIQGKDGRRLNFETARRYIRNINFLAHCHGSFVFLKLEEKLEDEMKLLGYTSSERETLLHNFFCVSFAPNAPVGVGKAQKMSFLSAADEEIYHYNQAERSIRRLADMQELSPCYLSGQRGNVFIVSKVSDYGDEHNWGGFGKRQKYLTQEGNALNELAGSALVGAMLSSLKGEELGEIRSLIEKGSENPQTVQLFDTFQKNGEKTWQQIKADIKTRMIQKRIFEQRLK